jgi:negative regulator of flagellin synthesis FlgM
VARVRAQIADGSYDTPDKMAMAFDAMLDELV